MRCPHCNGKIEVTLSHPNDPHANPPGLAKDNGAGANLRISRQSRTDANGRASIEESTIGAPQIAAPAATPGLPALSLSLKAEQNRSPGVAAPDPEKVYREVRRIYRRHVGKSIGALSPRRREWSGLVHRYGGEVVLRALEIWASELGRRGRNLNYPLAVFLSQVDEYIEAVSTPVEEKKEEEGLPRLEK